MYTVFTMHIIDHFIWCVMCSYLHTCMYTHLCNDNKRKYCAEILPVFCKKKI